MLQLLRVAVGTTVGAHLVFDTVGGPIADAVFDNLAKYARVLIVGRTASNNRTDQILISSICASSGRAKRRCRDLLAIPIRSAGHLLANVWRRSAGAD